MQAFNLSMLTQLDSRLPDPSIENGSSNHQGTYGLRLYNEVLELDQLRSNWGRDEAKWLCLLYDYIIAGFGVLLKRRNPDPMHPEWCFCYIQHHNDLLFERCLKSVSQGILSPEGGNLSIIYVRLICNLSQKSIFNARSQT
jgi:hypothetical protein